MTRKYTNDAALETTIGAAGVLTGIGVLLFALAPFAIPILLLTAVFAAPLLLPVVPIGILLVFALAIRGMWRLLRRPRRSAQPARTLGATSRAGSST